MNPLKTLADAAKLHLLCFIVSIAFASPLSSQVIINEYSASNLSSFADDFGKYEDWFELKNVTDTLVDLGGYGLSDDLSQPMKFVIPQGVVIAPNGYLRIWTSGRDGLFNIGHLHASFKLTQTKDVPEFIIAASPKGTVLDQVQLIKTMNGHSRGRHPQNINNWLLYSAPTPGSANSANGYTEYAAKPTLSVPAGFYSSGITLQITSPDPNAIIRYTTDGSEPTSTSPVYSTPIIVNQTSIVIARCYSLSEDILPGWLAFRTYFINAPSTLPVISISAQQLDELLNGNQSLVPFGTFEYFNKEGVRTTAGYGEFNEHGQDSWVHPQRSIDYITRDECGYNYAIRDTIIPITDRNEFQRIILRAAGDDNYPGIDSSALMRDMFVQNTADINNMHLDVRKGEKCLLYVNGQFWGIYGIREKVSDHDFTDYYYGQDKYHLYYLMLWGWSWAEYGDQEAWNDWNALHNYVMSNNMADSAVWAYVDSKLDYRSLADYIIINSFVVCSDWINYNVGWWRGTNPEGSHLKWGYILWDEDATFNHYINYTGIPNTLPDVSPCFTHFISNDPEQHIALFNRLRENPGFNQYYMSRYIDLYNTAFKTERMISCLDEIAGKMAPEMPKQIQRWGGNMTQWQNNVQKIRNFINTRYTYLPQGLEECFQLGTGYNFTVNVQPAGTGSVELNSLQLSGADFPWQGTYFNGLPINLKAVPADPTLEFDHWDIPAHIVTPGILSPEVQLNPTTNDFITAHFRLKTYADSLVINEINYNSAPSFDPGDWVEVYNPQPYDLDITGWQFRDEDDAHQFIFPAGTIIDSLGYLVICTNSAAFASLFPDVKNYIGDTGFGLAGGGELIRVYNAQGTLIDPVTYDDAAPWPTEPDGNGPTLELRRPSLDNALGENWVASPLHGTPGRLNSILVKAQDNPMPSEKIALTVSPNPVKTQNMITIGGIRVSAFDQLSLTDIMGMQVRNIALANGNSHYKLDMTGLAPGVYVLVYRTADGRKAEMKIVK